jgi:hypothetical protein
MSAFTRMSMGRGSSCIPAYTIAESNSCSATWLASSGSECLASLSLTRSGCPKLT